MSHVPHELSEEFPEQAELIGRLVQSDPDFAKLTEDYARINTRVWEADSYERPMEDLAEHQLKKQRMFLKDEITRRLAGDA